MIPSPTDISNHNNNHPNSEQSTNVFVSFPNVSYDRYYVQTKIWVAKGYLPLISIVFVGSCSFFLRLIESKSFWLEKVQLILGTIFILECLSIDMIIIMYRWLGTISSNKPIWLILLFFLVPVFLLNFKWKILPWFIRINSQRPSLSLS